MPNGQKVLVITFRFTFKLSKSITHAKGLEFGEEDIELFMQTIAHIGNKKGCLLIQFPPGLKIEKLDLLQHLLTAIKNVNANHNWKIAMEFRNNSWYNEEVYDLLKQYTIGMVIHDIPAPATPMEALITDHMYLRFHGPEGRYRGSYTNDFLYRHAQHIHTWIREGKTVYVYFNNTMGDAVANLQSLNSYVQSLLRIL